MTERTATPYEALRTKAQEHLREVYPAEDAAALADRVIQAFGVPEDCADPGRARNNWTQSDVIAITYGDTLRREGERPLVTLRRFFEDELSDVVTGVHVLPFFPYSSDDGFSIIDYAAVDPRLGDWHDVTALARRFKLMGDLVLNHCSAESEWFQNYRAWKSPGKGYFFEAAPGFDVSQVSRPRTSPLLRTVETADGKRQVWCTFSPDQVDLNYRNPELLLEIVRILRLYLEKGVKIFRFDAVAFLWKESGTSCLHLKQTHEIIKLFRLLLDHRAPDAVVVTETNVPNRENLTYFGNGNEAHAIYNFSLAPLLINTLVTGDCRHLKTWMMSMPPAQEGTAFLNFIASHDGVGMRPAEGLLGPREVKRLLDTMRRFGGEVSARVGPDGREKPYEINIALFDALKGTAANGPDELQVERFLCAHAIMLALEGIPAFYLHSFLATPNDREKYERSGHKRSINRSVLDADESTARLHDPATPSARVFSELKRLIRIRRLQSAFHPNATQYTLHLGKRIFAFWRQSINRDQSIFAIHNVSDEPQQAPLSELNLILTDDWADLISGRPVVERSGKIQLAPYQAMWISNKF